MPRLASLAKQDLLIEFASLKHACPEGIYISITPGDPALWTGVLFVRTGPYAPAILRFQIYFPTFYPDVPPLITFSSDIFHPLLTPLTTYTYSTGNTSEGETVSATDEERLPPGGFSLRHGFPQWFGRNRPRGANSPRGSLDPASDNTPSAKTDISVHEILDYMRKAFSSDEVLDSIPLEAAANPGAYHAWQTHREDAISAENGVDSRQVDTQLTTPASPTSRTPAETNAGKQRRPAQWNWEGVWEERVKRGIQMSLSEPVMFGGAGGGDDIIRFSDLDANSADRLKDMIALSVEGEMI